MSVRFVLAPQAALDLVEIWRYIKEQTSITIADRVESAIREKIAFLAGTPGAGHSRAVCSVPDNVLGSGREAKRGERHDFLERPRGVSTVASAF